MKRFLNLSIFTYLTINFMFFLVTSCKTEDPNKPKLLPVLTTTQITKITQNSATSGGIITSDGGLEITSRGVCWSLKPNPTINDSITVDAAGTGEFTSNLNNLITDTTYYVRAYATNSDGTAYGLQVSFRTLIAVFPVISTTEIKDITVSTANSGGNITFDGGNQITTRGVCWSTTQNPTILNDKTSDGMGKGTFISNITNLITGTIYYVRAYATNSVGTSYGLQVTFKTQSIPTITTTPATSITETTATAGGNITSDGGLAVTERGVCWSTNTNPTINDNKTTNSSGKAIFSCSITGLTLGTTYYIRSFATNSLGTAYGNQASFTTNGTVTDIDGNIYHYITIGTQIWMVENLKTTRYRDGSLIANVTENANWSASSAFSTGAWCDYYNTAENGIKYGHLYNWYAVNNNRKIAPLGWHVPTDAEWTTLTNYVAANLGSSLSVSKALTAKNDWTTSSNNGAIGNNLTLNNSTGFTALPGGFRTNDGTFGLLGHNGYWWSSSDGNTTAWHRGMSFDHNYVSYGNHYMKVYGLSVRCIKD